MLKFQQDSADDSQDSVNGSTSYKKKEDYNDAITNDL